MPRQEAIASLRWALIDKINTSPDNPSPVSLFTWETNVYLLLENPEVSLLTISKLIVTQNVTGPQEKLQKSEKSRSMGELPS